MPDSLKSFRTVWKDSGQSGNMTDSLESFRTFCKVSGGSKMFCGESGKILDSQESCWTIWKVSNWSGQSGNFYNLEGFRTVRRVSKLSREFPNSLESVKVCWPESCDFLGLCSTHFVSRIWGQTSPCPLQWSALVFPTPLSFREACTHKSDHSTPKLMNIPWNE